MIVLGITGQIGTGKSFVSKCFESLGAKVFDADKAVHQLLEEDAIKQAIESLFPVVLLPSGKICRKTLGGIVFSDPAKLKQLEGILHPAVSGKRESFLSDTKKDGHELAILDVPLLYQLGVDQHCDAVLLTTVDPIIQYERVLQRLGMTPEKIRAICKKQSLPKGAKPDFVVDTDKSEIILMEEVRKIKRMLCGK